MEKFPSDEALKTTYTEIKTRAEEAIRARKVIGNPLFKGTLLDRYQFESRYSLCAQGLIIGSSAHKFLVSAMNEIESAEPNVLFQPSEFLHVTLSEVAYNASGKSSAKVDANLALKYHQALRQNFPDYTNPIKLELYKVFPTLDPSETDQHTASLVAAFLTKGDSSIFTIRNDVRESIEQSNLEFSARLGHIKVIFVTLGRFIDKPTSNGQKHPVLDALQEINSHIESDLTTEIDALQLISTATSYVYSKGHVFIDPPIQFRKSERKDSHPTFLKPRQKIKLLTQQY